MTTTPDTVRRGRILKTFSWTAAALVLACSPEPAPRAPAAEGGGAAAATLVKPKAEIEAAWTKAQTIADAMYTSNRTAVYDMFHSVRLTTDWWTWSQDPLSFMNGVMLSTPAFESQHGIRELRLLDGPVTCGASLQGCTIFPAPLAVAASWDVDQAVAMYAAQGAEKKAKGANVSLSPTMQIIRDPRGGRNFESFSEDPYLSAQLAAAAVTGIQSNHIVATAKHYLDNDQETGRDTIIVNVDERTQHEVYLTPFRAAVDAGVGAFMCSYNRVATPGGATDHACENTHVLKTLLKGELGFRGFVMSDWGATHSGAKAANAGLDVEMNDNKYFLALDGQITDATAKEMARRIVFAHLVTGLDQNPTAEVTKAQGVETRVVSTAATRQAAQTAAEQSIVLLKNAAVNGVPVLPLSKTNRSIAVLGECADTNHVFQGKGSAEGLTTGKSIVTPRQAIATALGVSKDAIPYGTESNLDGAVSLATGKAAAIVVLCATSMEGYGDGGDRASLDFGAARSFSNASSTALATRVAATGTPTVVMVVSPGPMTMPWASAAEAILWGGLLGETQGTAIARVLFGDVNPSGKLPVTFGSSLDDYPTRSSAYGTASDMFPGNGTNVYYREGLNVGYRHFDARNITPLFPFGHGLSYTTFEYADLTVTPAVDPAAGEPVTVALDLTNTGAVAGAEVVQVYVGYPAAAGEPPRLLKAFRKVALTPGETQRVTLTLGPDAYQYWSDGWVAARGTYQVMVGSSSRDVRLTGSFDVGGGTTPTYALTIGKSGVGTGTVSSTPAGIACGATCAASFAAGTVVTLTATPGGANQFFTGWSGACTGSSPACTVTMSGARTVGATFTAMPSDHLLTVTRAGTGSGTVSAVGGLIDCGTKCSAMLPGDGVLMLTATAASGSTFAGWSGSCTGTAPTCSVDGSATRDVTATFDLAGTSVLLSQGKPATASSTEGSAYPASAAVDASTTTRWSSQFSDPQWIRVDLGQTALIDRVVLRWEGAYARSFEVQVSSDGTTWTSLYQTTAGAGGVQTLAVTGTGRYVRVYGTARATPYGYSLYDLQVWGTPVVVEYPVLTVTKAGVVTGRVISQPAGIDCGAACSAPFPTGTMVTLTALPDAASTFAGWGGACAGATSCVVSMAQSRDVTATFDPVTTTTYPLTVTRAGNGQGAVAAAAVGIDCGAACSAQVAAGTIVNLTATAASGSRFSGWGGACAGTGACSVTMSAAQSVTATFEVQGVTLPCANPVTFTHQTGNFNTTGALCLRTASTVNGWGCSNFTGRTVAVNGGTGTSACGAGPLPLAKWSDGYTYFVVSAGTYPWASIYTW